VDVIIVTVPATVAATMTVQVLVATPAERHAQSLGNGQTELRADREHNAMRRNALICRVEGGYARPTCRVEGRLATMAGASPVSLDDALFRGMRHFARDPLRSSGPMTTSLVVMFGVTLVTSGLTFREPELRKSELGERLLIAGFWFVPAVAVAIFADPEDRWGLIAVFSAACLGTGGRPALLMDEIVHLWPAGKEHLVRRRVIGLIAVLVTATVAAVVLVQGSS
jgi:hypothetical protein